MTLRNAIGTIIDENENIALWVHVNEESKEVIWTGEAQYLPNEYHEESDWKLFINDNGDNRINILLPIYKSDKYINYLKNELDSYKNGYYFLYDLINKLSDTLIPECCVTDPCNNTIACEILVEEIIKKYAPDKIIKNKDYPIRVMKEILKSISHNK